MPKPIVALVGRPNVGKSTLFNRLVGQRVAIVEDVPGTTRDRIYGAAEWSGREFTVIDTGGLESEPSSEMSRAIRAQAEVAVSEADVIVLVVDAREGLTAEDEAIAELLHASSKPVLVAANKADNPERRLDAVEFFGLGLAEVTAISSAHGTGTGDLLDLIVARLPSADAEESAQGVRVAIVGRPNVGKSSIVNAILGQERVVVSEVPGTTRDVIDTPIEHNGERIVLIDTAGIRRRGRIERGIELYSVIRTLKAVERSDVVVLVLDGAEGITAQDTHLAGFTRDNHKGLCIVVNKWDLVPKTKQVSAEFTQAVRSAFAFVAYAPVLFTSAVTRRGLGQVLDAVLRISVERNKRIPTARLNDAVERAVAAHQPPSRRGRRLKVLYGTQPTVNPPTFALFVNDPALMPATYERYLENRLREEFGFEGTAIRFFCRARSEREEQA
jgi:GTP-binding protein